MATTPPNSDPVAASQGSATAVSRASSFLMHEGTRSVPLPERVSFLLSKGVTEADVRAALLQCKLPVEALESLSSDKTAPEPPPTAHHSPWSRGPWFTAAVLAAGAALFRSTTAASDAAASSVESTSALRSQMDELSEVSRDLLQRQQAALERTTAALEQLRDESSRKIAALEQRLAEHEERRTSPPDPPPAASPLPWKRVVPNAQASVAVAQLLASKPGRDAEQARSTAEQGDNGSSAMRPGTAADGTTDGDLGASQQQNGETVSAQAGDLSAGAQLPDVALPPPPNPPPAASPLPWERVVHNAQPSVAVAQLLASMPGRDAEGGNGSSAVRPGTAADGRTAGDLGASQQKGESETVPAATQAGPAPGGSSVG